MPGPNSTPHILWKAGHVFVAVMGSNSSPKGEAISTKEVELVSCAGKAGF